MKKKKEIVTERKKKIEKKIHHAQVSTASLGTYKGESDKINKKVKQIKQKTMPSLNNTKQEKKRNSDILKRVLSK